MSVKHAAVGVCGLSCKLCPRYHSDIARCSHGGCKSTTGMWSECPIATCAIKKGIEYCGECGISASCARWRKKREYGLKHDSSVSYVKLEDNIAFIEKFGIEAFEKEQDKRCGLLARIIRKFDDGRSKSFYCVAAAMLDIEDIELCIAEVEGPSQGLTIKEKASLMKKALDEKAKSKGHSLKLRK